MSEKTVILGINFGGHDTSAALLVDGALVAVCEQERYSRDKHSGRFPADAIADCLKLAGFTLRDVVEVAVATDFVQLVRETYIRPALDDDHRLKFLLGDLERIREMCGIPERIRGELGLTCDVIVHKHHLCHLASAYYSSGFTDALLVSNDGKGEIESGVIGCGRNGVIGVVSSVNRYPDSLGLLYSAVTHF